MRHKQKRGAVPRLHARDQPQHLFLHRDVQRRGRLVRNNQLRLCRKGRSDQHTLAHAARQLVRILAQHPVGVGDLHFGQQVARAGVGLRAGPAQDIDQPVGHLRPDPARRVQRRQRVLRDQRAGRADAPPTLGRGQPQQVGAPQQDFAAKHLNRAGQDAQHRLADHRLSGAAFAHQPAHFALRHRQRHIAQQTVWRAPHAGRQVAYLQKAHRSTGSKRSFNPSPSWLKLKTVRNSVISGKTSTHQA